MTNIIRRTGIDWETDGIETYALIPDAHDIRIERRDGGAFDWYVYSRTELLARGTAHTLSTAATASVRSWRAHIRH